MRQLNWNVVVANKVPSTFWEKVDESKRTIDTQELENLFSAKPAPTTTAASGAPGAPAKGAHPQKKAGVILLDPKKSNNCSIMLSRFKMALPELSQCILRLDDAVLDLETTGNLMQYVPTKEEIELLQDYDGPREELAKAEQFYLEVKDIPNLALRLNSWHFKLRFDDQFDELKEDLTALLGACKEVIKSQPLHAVLEYVLSIGNYINGGTARGGAYGFRLETLPKLADMKANDGKTTLIHFLIEQIKSSQNPDLVEFPSTLSHCAHASKVSLPILQSSVASMKKDLEILLRELPQLTSVGSDDKFKNVMTPFVEKAEKAIASLETMVKECGEKFVEVCKFFGENEKTATPEELFSVITAFSDSFQRIERAINEKAQQKQKQLLSSQNAAAAQGPPKANVDSLIEGLKRGDHFKSRRSVRGMNADLIKLRQMLPEDGQAEPPLPSPTSALGQPSQTSSVTPTAHTAQTSSVTPTSHTAPPASTTSQSQHVGQTSQNAGVTPSSLGLTSSQTITATPVKVEVAKPKVITSTGSIRVATSGSGISRPGVQSVIQPAPLQPPPVLRVAQPKIEVPHCKALFDFTKEQEGELPMKKGDVVLLKRRLDSVWLQGELNGQVGAFPANYVEIIIDLPQ
eukprot:TRINITY_DN1859_c0_g1_i3.p1 TRINITY_DN1859_c0_g1~~TRINITY_DN1859_c0_g1_i3.p1  ORF type:complete len:666 (-),score=201.40 TRINITY_DN1859_c0_g1_i3:108-2000(-)